jgi:hypothetical protein
MNRPITGGLLEKISDLNTWARQGQRVPHKPLSRSQRTLAKQTCVEVAQNASIQELGYFSHLRKRDSMDEVSLPEAK